MPIKNIARVELPHINGLPEDKVIQTWAFHYGDGNLVSDNFVATAIRNYVETVFTFGIGTGAPQVNEFMSSLIDFPNARCKVYDADGIDSPDEDGPVGSPYADLPLSITPDATDGQLPSEVAICVTHYGEFRDTQPVEVPDSNDAGTEVDRPKQRHTGRIYWGPWGANAISSLQSAQGRPSGTLLTALGNGYLGAQLAADAATDGSGDGNGLRLAVWSRRGGVFHLVDKVAVDDAWDTQRSRGVRRTTNNITTIKP